MSSHDKEQSHCDAYEKILDLDLFNALLALVVKMSDNKDAMLEYSRFISQKSLWASRCNDPGAYFAQHELRYIGEITERTHRLQTRNIPCAGAGSWICPAISHRLHVCWDSARRLHT